MKKLAITGGSGFLAYHAAHYFSKSYDEILLLDIIPVEERDYPSNVRFAKVDVTDFTALDSSLVGMDAVIHAAAALPLYPKKQIFETNVNGTENVLKISRSRNIQRVVYISSTSVYGVPKQCPIGEDAPLTGVGSYGTSKIRAEEICLQYRKAGFCVPIIRPKTFIGTGRLGIFQILYDWVKSGKRIPVIGNGRNRYQLLEVSDLVNAIDMMLTKPVGQVNDTFNIGAERFETVSEDLGELFRFAGTGASIMPTPAGIAKPVLSLLENLKLSPLYKWVYATADKDSIVSVQKIRNSLGWSAKFSNADALIKSYSWYLDHLPELSRTGISHRAAWNQGILKIFKKFL